MNPATDERAKLQHQLDDAKARGGFVALSHDLAQGSINALAAHATLLAEALPHLRDSMVPWHAHRGPKCGDLIRKIEATIGSGDDCASTVGKEAEPMKITLTTEAL